MHYHLEIVMPPTDEVEKAVEKILARFQEGRRDEDGGDRHAFWDWYEIGGRWAGNKLRARHDPAKLQTFYDWLNAEKVTVSGVVCGKETLSPASQQTKVDAKWREMFGGDGPCPIFDHSPRTMDGDVCVLEDVPERLTCSRFIIVNANLEPSLMIAESSWNGVTHVQSKWDGTFRQAMELAMEKDKHYRDEYRAQHSPKSNWLVVTVDYHS